MHFWDIDALATELRTGKLTEDQAFRYFLLVVVVQTLPLFLPLRNERTLTFYSTNYGAVIPIVWFITSIAGLVICFKGNQKSDGVDFIRRFVCLEIPAFVRTIALGIPLMLIVLLIVVGFIPSESRHTFGFVFTGISIELMGIAQYSMIYQRLRNRLIEQTGPKIAA